MFMRVAVLLFTGLIFQDWYEFPVKIEQVGENVYITFQPQPLTGLRVNRPFERAQAFGVDGEIKVSCDSGVVRFEKKVEAAEIVLFKCSAEKLRVEVLKSESKREARTPKESELEELGEFKPTFYWVLLEEGFKGERDTPLPGEDGKSLGLFPKEFVKQAKIEGSAKLKDGRVLNVAGKGFKVVDAPNGLGAGKHHLIPFRSIAVDPKEIPLGTKIFIKEAVGMKLPDGTLHDGVFYAHDVGGGIKGKRIDLFTGAGEQMSVFEKARISNMKPLKLFRVK